MSSRTQQKSSLTPLQTKVRLDEFNTACPLGARVRYWLDGQERTGFIMRPAAETFGRLCVWICGVIGPVPIVDVTPISLERGDSGDDDE